MLPDPGAGAGKVEPAAGVPDDPQPGGEALDAFDRSVQGLRDRDPTVSDVHLVQVAASAIVASLGDQSRYLSAEDWQRLSTSFRSGQPKGGVGLIVQQVIHMRRSLSSSPDRPRPSSCWPREESARSMAPVAAGPLVQFTQRVGRRLRRRRLRPRRTRAGTWARHLVTATQAQVRSASQWSRPAHAVLLLDGFASSRAGPLSRRRLSAAARSRAGSNHDQPHSPLRAERPSQKSVKTLRREDAVDDEVSGTGAQGSERPSQPLER